MASLPGPSETTHTELDRRHELDAIVSVNAPRARKRRHNDAFAEHLPSRDRQVNPLYRRIRSSVETTDGRNSLSGMDERVYSVRA